VEGIVGHYNPFLVLVSVLVAIVSAFVAIGAIPRIHNTVSPKRSALWSVVFGASMGGGVWVMHFTAMLAFHLPVAMSYDLFLTLLSLFVAMAICSTAVLPFRNQGRSLSTVKIIISAALMGSGIVSMHYIGMEAMHMNAEIHYSGISIALSISASFIASFFALKIADHIRSSRVLGELKPKLMSSIGLGIAVSSMHYIAMIGTTFVATNKGVTIDHMETANIMAVFILLVLIVSQTGTMIIALLDESLELTREKLGLEAKVRKISEAVEQAGEAILITDHNGIIEYTNPSFSRTTGYSNYEAIGNTPAIIKSGNQDTSFYTEMWNEILGGNVWQGEVIERRKDGSFYPATLTISPVQDKAGEITNFIGIHEDLSGFKNLEEQFRRAQKLEAMGILVAGIAHDFNNVLAGLIGNLYLAKKKVKDIPDIFQKLQYVEKVSFDTSDVVRQMLNYSRNDDGELRNFSLTAFIKETLKLYEVSAPDGVSLGQRIGSDELIIRASTTQIQQVILNLLKNAYDAVRSTSDARVEIELEPYEIGEEFCRENDFSKPGKYAHITICDNGTGIRESNLKHIFEPFFTTKEAENGTGLGLPMCKQIVESFHGTIMVDSEYGEGSAFHVYLPLASKEKGSSREKVFSAKDISKGNGESILVVEEHDWARNAFINILQDHGYIVHAAKSSKQALNIFTDPSRRVELILTDILMAGLNGCELVKKITDINSRVRVVFISGDKSESEITQFEGLGETPVLSKPFKAEELLNMVHHILNKK